MAFRSNFIIGATIQDIRSALHPEQYIKPEKEIEGIRWIKISSDAVVQNHECDPKVHVPNELPAGDSALPGANNEHNVHSIQ